MCLAQGPQRSDDGEAPTRGPSVSSQVLYHWATVLPHFGLDFKMNANTTVKPVSSGHSKEDQKLF